MGSLSWRKTYIKLWNVLPIVHNKEKISIQSTLSADRLFLLKVLFKEKKNQKLYSCNMTVLCSGAEWKQKKSKKKELRAFQKSWVASKFSSH